MTWTVLIVFVAVTALLLWDEFDEGDARMNWLLLPLQIALGIALAGLMSRLLAMLGVG